MTIPGFPIYPKKFEALLELKYTLITSSLGYVPDFKGNKYVTVSRIEGIINNILRINGFNAGKNHIKLENNQLTIATNCENQI